MDPRIWWRAAPLGLCWAFLLLAAPGATADTPLVASTPSAQGRVEVAPTHVVLEFDLPVEADAAAVSVLDAAGA